LGGENGRQLTEPLGTGDQHCVRLLVLADGTVNRRELRVGLRNVTAAGGIDDRCGRRGNRGRDLLTFGFGVGLFGG
jgi:hypothetical protein